MPILSTALIKRLGAGGLTNAGSFATLGALQSAWPSPQDGMFALVGVDGTSGDESLYASDGGTWSQLSGGGGGAVDSVNGETGDVVLDAADVGAMVELTKSTVRNFGGITLLAVQAAATSNVNIASPGATIEGYSPSVNDTFALTNETSPVDNGVWAWNGAAVPMTRSARMPAGSETTAWRDRLIYVRGGGNHLGKVFRCTVPSSGATVGTDNLTFAQEFIESVANPREIKTGNFTAVNGGEYVVNGTMTVTDPAGVVNKGYVIRINDTAGTNCTVGGVPYTVPGAMLWRFYNGSAWQTGYYPAVNADGVAGQMLVSDGGVGPLLWVNAPFSGRLFDRVEVKGPLTTGLITYQVAHAAGSIAGVKITVTGLPTGSSVKVDIRKNGTATTDSVFTSDTEAEITTGTGATNNVYTVTKTAIDNGTFAADDVAYFYVTLTGSTLPGTNLSVVTY